MRFRFAGPRRLIAAVAWIVLFAIASSASAESLRLVVWKQRHLMQLKAKASTTGSGMKY